MEIPLFREFGITLIASALFIIVRRLYKNQKAIKKIFESIRFTISFFLINIIMFVYFIFDIQNVTTDKKWKI